MTFLNPAYLGALALIAIPILIHLIRRRRVRIVPWAAWEFLLQSRRRNRRRLRLEQLLLLLLRIFILCLVALAFARPLFRTLGLPLVAADTRVHALLALDNSYSMGFQRDGVTDFERAKRVADDLLTRVLKPGDSVSVALVSSRPEALLKEPTFDLGKARERVRTARLSDRDTDYGAGAELCATLLANVRTPTKEVYWITDSQKAGFPESGRERTQAAWKRLAEQARVTWIDVAVGNRENLSVEAPAFSRELMTPQAPVRIEAILRNHSANARNGLLVNLSVDGRPAGSARVDLPAGGEAKASFVYLFEKAGVHTGSIQFTQPDGLERDNVAYFAAKVREKLNVLIVNPRPSDDPTRDEAFYLATALAPSGASQGGSTAIQATIHSGSRLGALNLRNYDAVVITGLTDLAPIDRSALEEYVRNGGGLLLFPGPDTDPARVNAAFGASSSSTSPLSKERGGETETLLPARLGARRLLEEEAALTLNPATIAHPALAVFRDTTEVHLGSARFTLVYDLVPSSTSEGVSSPDRNPEPNPENPVLCRFSGGQPAFVERKFGQGRVILAASTAGVSGSNLPYKPAYVPLAHQLVAYLAAGPTAQRNLRVGEPLMTRFPVQEAGKPIRLTDPTGQTRLQRSRLSSEGVLFTYADTARAGHYRVEVGTGAVQNPRARGQNPIDVFAVNLPSGESDLASATTREIQAALGPASIQFLDGRDDLRSAVHRSRRGTEFWRPLVLLVLPLLFLEALLAQRFGRRG